MSMMSVIASLKLSRPAVRSAITVAGLAVLCSTIARIVIANRLDSTSFTEEPGTIIEAFLVGAAFDMAVAMLLAAPYLLWVEIFSPLWKRGIFRALAHGVTAGGIVLLVFGGVAEIFFWEEFSNRFNGIAIFYLIFPREVIGNIQESFDLSLYLPPVILAGIVMWWKFRHVFAAGFDLAPQARRKRRSLATTAGIVAVSLLVINVLNPDFSGNREIGQLASNGLVTMAQAALTNDADYDGVYPGMPERSALPLVHDLVAQDNTRFLKPESERNLVRFVDNGASPKKLNIIVVTEESFGSNMVDDLDSRFPYPLSPNLTRLAKDGLYFTNIYASGQRTVRGLEATMTAFAPIPGISTARRPGAVGMHSLPHLLKQHGYNSGMLYGGAALFDNMGTFWEGIGFDHVWDQSDIRHESFSTIWGVSDEDLFTEALQRMDENTVDGTPFLLTLMTVSNHRPYKFPQTHIKWDDTVGKRQNTTRYADWAFGNFIERAREKPWFDDTVFVFVADHSRKVNGAARVPLERFRIPMLFYSPKHIKPGRIDTLGAQIDMTPTLLGQLGFSYENPFFGIDLMRVPEGGGWISVAHNFSIAFARPGHAVVLDPDGKVKGYRFKVGNVPLEEEEPDPETTRQAIALTQTAHHMFYNREYHVPSAR